MSAKSQTFRVVSIAGAAGVADSAVGGSIDENITMLETYPSGRITPCLAYDRYSLKVVTKFSEPFAPPTGRLSQSSTDVVFTLLNMDNQSTTTVTCSGMLPTEFHANMDQHPNNWELQYAFDAGNTDNIDPISVA